MSVRSISVKAAAVMALCASVRAADSCCPTTPESALWGRFADQAASLTARGLNALPVLSEPLVGVTDLSLSELLVASGGQGLSYSPKAKALAGRPVRVAGFMVHQQTQVPGVLLLTSRPIATHESEDGLCEDLPAATLYVLVPELANARVPLIAGPLVLTGTLTLGSRAEGDGRNSVARLQLSSPSLFSTTALPRLAPE